MEIPAPLAPTAVPIPVRYRQTSDPRCYAQITGHGTMVMPNLGFARTVRFEGRKSWSQ